MPRHRFLIGHVLEALRALPNESVHCCVTSPPYWGLRDYGLPPIAWPEVEYVPLAGLPPVRVPSWTGQLGLEPVPEMYVAHLVLVFREVRRVLRKDGTVWLNLGDSYAGSGGAHAEHHNNPGISNSWKRNGVPHYGKLGTPERYLPPAGLKAKDLTGVPWRVAFALQADGWWLRSEITWCKKAPMPESVKDRPTNATEKVFLFARSPKYFYDAEAVREKSSGSHNGSSFTKGKTAEARPGAGQGERVERPGRNMRNYWLLGPEPFPEAHFAVFVTEIPRRAVLAGTSGKGCCPQCGAPWVRAAGGTAGWRPTCSCGTEGAVPCVVLDPFGGAGTTTLVADRLGRDSVYIDLRREYAEMALKRVGAGERMFVDCELVEVGPDSGAAHESPPHRSSEKIPAASARAGGTWTTM